MFICSCVQNMCACFYIMCGFIERDKKKSTHLNFSFTPFTITPCALLHKSFEPFYPLNDIQKIITLYFKDLARHIQFFCGSSTAQR